MQKKGASKRKKIESVIIGVRMTPAEGSHIRRRMTSRGVEGLEWLNA